MKGCVQAFAMQRESFVSNAPPAHWSKQSDLLYLETMMQQQQPRAVNSESSEGAAALGPVSDIHSINDVHRQAVVELGLS
jgi:hypothetical protein